MSTDTENWLPRHRLTVDDYYRIAEAGVLAMDARVELIEGEIIDMAPPGSRHAAVVSFLVNVFGKGVGDSAVISIQQPLRLDQMNEPQPDLALLRPRRDFYSSAHPGAADALLVIE